LPRSGRSIPLPSLFSGRGRPFTSSAGKAGSRVLIPMPDVSGIPKPLAVLDSAFPGIRLWPDGVRVAWRGENGAFHLLRVPGTEVWPFLEDGFDRSEPDEPDELQKPPDTTVVETYPLPQLLRGIIQDFLKAGKAEATSGEILAALSASERAWRTDKQVGIALGGAGLRRHRIRVNWTRPHDYESSTPWTSSGPAGQKGTLCESLLLENTRGNIDPEIHGQSRNRSVLEKGGRSSDIVRSAPAPECVARAPGSTHQPSVVVAHRSGADDPEPDREWHRVF